MPVNVQYNTTNRMEVGLSMPLILSETRRVKDIEASLRYNWSAEGVTCDIPLWLNTGITQFNLDMRFQSHDAVRLEEYGLVLFDPTVRNRPSVYTIPEPERSPRMDDLDSSATQAQDQESSTRERSSAPHASDTKQSESNFGQENTQATDQPLKMNIPRFLAWASSGPQKKTRSDEIGVSATPDYSERVLDSMHELLSSGEDPERMTRAHVYKWARTTSRVILLQLRPSLDTSKQSGAAKPSKPAAQDGTQGTQQLSLSERTADSQSSDMVDATHRGLQEQCERDVRAMFTVVSEVLDYFLPLSTNHQVIKKCWGAFEVMLGLLVDALAGGTNTGDVNPSFWVIRDISDQLTTLGVPRPEYGWKECRACQSGTVYRSQEEALDHLRAVHYNTSSSSGKTPRLPKEHIIPWIRDFRQYSVDQRLDLFLRYITMSLGYLRSIHARATHIREGVADSCDSKSGKYLLPKSLVKSFEHTIMLIVCTPRAFTLVDRYCRHFQDNLQDKSRESRDRLPLESIRDELDTAGSAAILTIEKAEQDILLMARTNYDHGVVKYDDVGPEYLLATIMENLAERSLLEDKAVNGVYQMFHDRLYSDVLKHPRAKVLRDLFLMREELRWIRTVNEAQGCILRDYQSVLEPCTFKATTTTRCSRFTTESHFLENQMRNRFEVDKSLASLEVRLDDLNTKVWQILQVNQENHGNAILVFTIVTIIFLPLSWATSYLGMNTSDIRDLEQGQWLFWSIGGPLAAVVIGVALLAVLKGEAIREYIIRKEEKFRVKLIIKKDDQNGQRASTFMSARKSTTLDEKSWVRKRKRRVYAKVE